MIPRGLLQRGEMPLARYMGEQYLRVTPYDVRGVAVSPDGKVVATSYVNGSASNVDLVIRYDNVSYSYTETLASGPSNPSAEFIAISADYQDILLFYSSSASSSWKIFVYSFNTTTKAITRKQTIDLGITTYFFGSQSISIAPDASYFTFTAGTFSGSPSFISHRYVYIFVKSGSNWVLNSATPTLEEAQFVRSVSTNVMAVSSTTSTRKITKYTRNTSTGAWSASAVLSPSRSGFSSNWGSSFDITPDYGHIAVSDGSWIDVFTPSWSWSTNAPGFGGVCKISSDGKILLVLTATDGWVYTKSDASYTLHGKLEKLTSSDNFGVSGKSSSFGLLDGSTDMRVIGAMLRTPEGPPLYRDKTGSILHRI